MCMGLFVTLVAVATGSESALAIVATAAGLALFHIGHGRFAGALAIVKFFGMAIVARVDLGVEVVAEHGIIEWF